MPGFDWNGNGKTDLADHFMDMDMVRGTHDGGINFSVEKSGAKKETADQRRPVYNASKNGNCGTIAKSLFVSGLCLGGIVLPVVADFGTLGTLGCILGGVVVSILILRKHD